MTTSIAAPDIFANRAITIDAPVEDVWPWLVQIGQHRGGFYSYTFLENLVFSRMRNADHIVPEWQHLDAGDQIYLHPMVALDVHEVDQGHHIVLEGWGTFLVRPLASGQTRFIVRTRGNYEPNLGRIVNIVAWDFAFDLAHFIMEREMLLGIKQRAERLYAERRP